MVRLSCDWGWDGLGRRDHGGKFEQGEGHPTTRRLGLKLESCCGLRLGVTRERSERHRTSQEVADIYR